MYSWVYKYRYWDEAKQQQVVSRDLFTMDAIRAGLGTVIIESGTRVPADQVDEHGRVRLGPVTSERKDKLSH